MPSVRPAPGEPVTVVAGLRRHALAPLVGIALAGYAVWGLVAVVPTLVALAWGAERPVQVLRGVPRLARTLADRWCGVPIPDPYLPAVAPAPNRRPDGRYRAGMRLYDSARTPVRLGWTRQFRNDPATRRDLAWQVVNPVVGAAIALASAAAVVAGAVAVLRPSGAVGATAALGTGLPAVAVVVGLAVVAAGVALGPALLVLHGRWTATLLGPAPPPTAGPGLRTGPLLRVRALGGGILLFVLSCYGFLLAVAQVVMLALALPTSTLAPAYVQTLRPARALTDLYRRLAAEWSDVRIDVPYRERPDDPLPGPDGLYEHRRTLHASAYAPTWLRLRDWALTDPSTWRDLAWLLVDPAVAAVMLLTPPVLAVVAVAGVLVPAVLSAFGIEDPNNGWAALVARLPLGTEVIGSLSAAVPVALAVLVAVWWIGPHALRGHALVAALLLGPTGTTVIADRLREVARTRQEAAGTQAAELRRIERDLHDGAQARLVAIGMTLRAVERRLDNRPDDAELLRLVTEARTHSAAALAELRDLVRGIHPPVLAERGLGDAVRALGLDTPLATTVTVDVPGRADAPVEACVYFSVSEALANAAKHANATRVAVSLVHRRGLLEVVVDDDGDGGADPAAGTGLRGMQRRLATFDGTLQVSSPPGGPTRLIMEVPCALSSPRTSTS